MKISRMNAAKLLYALLLSVRDHMKLECASVSINIYSDTTEPNLRNTFGHVAR